jgi:hypothetical protein
MQKTIVDVAAGTVIVRPLTSEEVAALPLPAPPPPPDYLAQIDALEREHQMPKVTREFMLASMEEKAIELGATQGLTPEQSIAALRAGNPGYRKVKELDERIAALRALL